MGGDEKAAKILAGMTKGQRASVLLACARKYKERKSKGRPTRRTWRKRVADQAPPVD